MVLFGEILEGLSLRISEGMGGGRGRGHLVVWGFPLFPHPVDSYRVCNSMVLQGVRRVTCLVCRCIVPRYIRPVLWHGLVDLSHPETQRLLTSKHREHIRCQFGGNVQIWLISSLCLFLSSLNTLPNTYWTDLKSLLGWRRSFIFVISSYGLIEHCYSFLQAVMVVAGTYLCTV